MSLKFRTEEGRARVLWTLQCVTGACDTEGLGGQHPLWYADRHHREPFVPSGKGKGNDSFWQTGFRSSWGTLDFK